MNLLFIVAICIIDKALSLTAKERDAVLIAHNAYRSALAIGEAVNRDGRPLPSGENIYELNTDETLERMTQDWADECVFAHSSPEQRNNSGQNLYFTTAPLSHEKVLEDASDAWWKELSDYGVNSDLRFTIDEFNRGIGHWSQMAWGWTTKIGCGVRFCPAQNFLLVVCNYFPAGNILNRQIYERGEPCEVDAQCTAYQKSSCREGTKLCTLV